MPANTANRAYTYATIDDANDLALISQRLAEQLDADVTAILARDARRLAQFDTTTAVSDSDGTADTVTEDAFIVPDYGATNRLVRFELDARLNASVANNLVNCTVLVDGADVTYVQAVIPATGGSGQPRLGNARSVPLTPGSHTYKVTTKRVTGSGTGGVAEVHLTITDAGVA